MKKQIKEIFKKEEELEKKIFELEEIMKSSADLTEKMSSVRVLIDEMRREIIHTHYEALTDDLTGFLKKKVIKAVYRKKAAEATRNKDYLSIVLIDIDKMKIYNDTFGHLAGTRLIEDYAKAISKSIRGQDLASRYGGDEFLLLCVHKDPKSINGIIERIREKISMIKVADHFINSASFGFFSCPYKEIEKMSFEKIFEKADKVLYKEKKEKKKLTEGTK